MGQAKLIKFSVFLNPVSKKKKIYTLYFSVRLYIFLILAQDVTNTCYLNNNNDYNDESERFDTRIFSSSLPDISDASGHLFMV